MRPYTPAQLVRFAPRIKWQSLTRDLTEWCRLFHTRATAYSEDIGTLTQGQKRLYGEQMREYYEARNLHGERAGGLPHYVAGSQRWEPVQTQSRAATPQSSVPTGSTAASSQHSSSGHHMQLEVPISKAYQQPAGVGHQSGSSSWSATTYRPETVAHRPESSAQLPIPSSPTNVENLEAVFASSHSFQTASAAAAQPALQEHAPQACPHSLCCLQSHL